MGINEIIMLILKACYFALPIYSANMIPVIIKKRFMFLATPIDNGFKIKGKPLFGKNKTWRGLIFGGIAGAFVFWIQIILYSKGLTVSISLIEYTDYSLLFGGLLGVCAIIGDMIESFFKRRLSIKPSQPWIPFDQIDFIIGALIVSYIIFPLSIKIGIILIIITPILHIATSRIAFYLKIRDEKW